MKYQVKAFLGARRQQLGFTLVELMVGMLVGLLSTLVIANLLTSSEGNKRSATSGSDAQVNGGLAVYALQRQLKMAGYGLTTEGTALGCTLSARFGGAAVASLPPTLAPVLITAGAAGAPDTVRVLASSKASFALPTRLIAPYYDPNDTVGDKARRFAVASSLGVNQGDLLVLVYGANQACQVFQVSNQPAVGQINRIDAGSWNANKFPNAVASNGSYLVNMGALVDTSFSITADLKLRQSQADLLTQTSSNQDLQSNIVTLKALYGKDTNGDDVVDTFDAVTPTNNAEWLQVRAVRVAVLARSAQYEKEEVTASAPQWDVGTFAAVAGSAACGTSKCIALKADATDDWKHYRYKVFDTLVPLRNQLWRSDFTSGAVPQPPAAP
jgi:type IV pilus assembly protein PilW